MEKKVYEVLVLGEETHEVIASNPENAATMNIFWRCHGNIAKNYSKCIKDDHITVSEMIDHTRVYRKYAIYFDPDIQLKLVAVSSEIIP